MPAVRRDYTRDLVVLWSLFFVWGFITCLNGILIPKLKAVFVLDFATAMLVQLAFFAAYGLFSLPSGRLVERFGYQRGIVIGLGIAALGCLGFLPAASQELYSLFLASLFVLACGITLLQVSANAYVTILGPAGTASARLTLTQAFNSLGTFLAQLVGTALILAPAGALALGQSARAVKLPYVGLAVVLVLLAVFMGIARLPQVEAPEVAELEPAEPTSQESAWQHRNLVLGALAIFLYVGGEVAIGSLLVNYLGEASIGGKSAEQAGHLASYYWGGAMLGRFIGSLTMRHLTANRTLAAAACSACLLLVVTMTTSGVVATWSVISIGLFNSIMFPTIYSLALARLGKHTSQGSGILCMAMVGGALIPYLQGVVADQLGLQHSFVVPLFCYASILLYALRGWSPVKIQP